MASNKGPRKRTIPDLLKKIFREIISQKKWVLLPLWALLAILGLLLVFAGSSYLLPAIYIAV